CDRRWTRPRQRRARDARLDRIALDSPRTTRHDGRNRGHGSLHRQVERSGYPHREPRLLPRRREVRGHGGDAREPGAPSHALSAPTFQSCSSTATVGSSVPLAARRGSGLLGTSIQMVPATVFDSTIVKVTGPIGTSNATNGQTAAPKLITSGNGQAKIYVLGL